MWQIMLLVLDQKFSDWLIKIMFLFLGEGETAMESGIKSKFGIMGFQHAWHHFGSMVFSLTIESSKDKDGEKYTDSLGHWLSHDIQIYFKIHFLGFTLALI